MGQRREGDVTGRLAACRAVLAMEFRGEAVQGAGPHVLRRSGGVGSAGGRRAALGRSSWWTRNRKRLPNRAESGSAGAGANLLPRYECSGVERWPWVGDRADKLCVGDPGRLSLEDRDRFKEDRLRLVCSRLDCFVIFLNRELRFLLQEEKRWLQMSRCLNVTRPLVVNSRGGAREQG